MTFDHNIIDSLMRWARLQAPLAQIPYHAPTPDNQYRRAVRIEISGPDDQPYHAPECKCEKCSIVCRVYLAEPRCQWKHDNSYVTPEQWLKEQHECGPIAETRIA